MTDRLAGDFVLDKAPILDRLGGDEEIYTMMLDMFIQDVENNCAQLDAALAGGVAEDIRREIHTVKGLLATFSDDAGAAAAYAFEQRAKQGELAGLDAAIKLLQARLREIAAVLAASRPAKVSA